MKLPSMTMMTTAVVWSVVWPFCAALLQTTLNNNDNINNGATDDASPPVISTSSGRIHGKIDPALPNVHQYLGIPYAVPPVGERRWTAPELLDQPDVDVQATQFRPSCMQFLTKLGNTLYTRDVLEFNVEGLNTTGAVSEDCLTLSVWTPANASANATTGYPVVIFIHGGAFAVGGQNVPYQIPAQWVDRDPHHLVVSFNYRLNIFGFPTAAGLRQQQQQNLGLLDQRAVVEWCRANVAAFGGDPARMVLWGNSAGAISADYYNFAHAADPLVTGFILDSGTALSPTPTGDTAFSNFSFVAAHVGCGGLGPAGPDDVEAAAAELRCMRGVPAQTIEDFVQEYRDSLAEPTILFHPSYDEVLVFSNYTARAEAGLQANLVRPFFFVIHISTPRPTHTDLATSPPLSAATPKTASRSRPTTPTGPTQPTPPSSTSPSSFAPPPKPSACDSSRRPLPHGRRHIGTSTTATGPMCRRGGGWARTTLPSCP